MAESCTICSSRSRRPVRKLLDTASYLDYVLNTRVYKLHMEQSLYWEANSRLATQEIPRILWNPNVHYRVHKRPLEALCNIS
jgi:hypothetical protein